MLPHKRMLPPTSPPRLLAGQTADPPDYVVQADKKAFDYHGLLRKLEARSLKQESWGKKPEPRFWDYVIVRKHGRQPRLQLLHHCSNGGMLCRVVMWKFQNREGKFIICNAVEGARESRWIRSLSRVRNTVACEPGKFPNLCRILTSLLSQEYYRIHALSSWQRRIIELLSYSTTHHSALTVTP